MALSPDAMRFLLITFIVIMTLLAFWYLRRRKLTLVQYAFWGLLAIFPPILGPFLVILLAPGGKTRDG